ncbi:UNVERIFIED_CONTAM: putative clathrin assembly protein [Sesamum latifolium]|uniref:Clathrin assembly protein n=1 Tax=Sesamum latifolium TaxID=2727402 RepID=A0AAW2VG98_9LAMI
MMRPEEKNVCRFHNSAVGLGFLVPFKMATGSGSSQQNLRKAILAIRDSTKVGIAKVNSEYKDLKVSILKATNHLEVLPKEKHFLVRNLEQLLVIAYIHLQGVLEKHVALKTLIVIHRALREVDHSFCEELMYHNQSGGHLLNLSHFRDDSSPSAWDYSTWIRSYALYIEECLECFRVLKYDFHRDHTPIGAARYNFIIQYALSIFFEMQRCDAVKALEIYRRAGEQAPASFLTAMEEYVKDAPEALPLPWRASWDEPSQEESKQDAGNSLPDLIITPEDLSDPTISSQLSSQPPSWELALATVPVAEPGSYVGSVALSKGGVLDRSILDSLYDTPATKANTSGPYQIANVSSNPFEADAYNQEMFYDPSLVVHPSFMQVQQAAFMQQQEAAQQSQAIVPFDYMQIAGIAQPQQPASMQQQEANPQSQAIVPYDYMQIAGITQPQQPALVQKQDSSFTGDGFMQMIPMPQPEVSMMMQQQQDKSMVGIDSSNPFGNPFMEQVSLPVAPHTQPSTLSLL